MNLIRNIFSWWSEAEPKIAKTPQPGFETYTRYFENVDGDFYVQNDVCTACGAPEAEAPDLIGHSEINHYHCYFKKQPQTEDELGRAIDALRVACCDGIRYGGKDENILKRLYELGSENECDQKPLGNYKMIIRTRVTFTYLGTTQELFELVSNKILSRSYYKIFDVRLDDDHFTFMYRWMEGENGTIYSAKKQNDNFEIQITKEPGGNIISLQSAGGELNEALQNDFKASNVTWFDMDKSNIESYLKPY